MSRTTFSTSCRKAFITPAGAVVYTVHARFLEARAKCHDSIEVQIASGHEMAQKV